MPIHQIHLDSSSSNCYTINDYDSTLFRKIIVFEMALQNTNELHLIFNGTLGGEPLNLKLIAKYDSSNKLVFKEKGRMKLFYLYAKKINFKSALKNFIMYPFSSKKRQETSDVFRAICLNGITKKYIF